MTDREKLIKVLMKQVGYTLPVFTATQTIELLADCLIANGVTFAKDTDAPSKWIRVEDRLPEEARVPKDVLVYHKLGNCGSYVDRAWYDRDKSKWRSALGMNMKVTHWMPMPEPPGGDAE